MSDSNLRFTRNTFQPHQGSTFLVLQDEGAVEMKLREVTDTTPQGYDGEQFSLVFQGPHDPALDQRIYSMRHDVLGTVELFIVPVGAPKEGRLYEAYFNLTAQPGA